MPTLKAPGMVYFPTHMRVPDGLSFESAGRKNSQRVALNKAVSECKLVFFLTSVNALVDVSGTKTGTVAFLFPSNNFLRGKLLTGRERAVMWIAGPETTSKEKLDLLIKMQEKNDIQGMLKLSSNASERFIEGSSDTITISSFLSCSALLNLGFKGFPATALDSKRWFSLAEWLEALFLDIAFEPILEAVADNNSAASASSMRKYVKEVLGIAPIQAEIQAHRAHVDRAMKALGSAADVLEAFIPNPLLTIAASLIRAGGDDPMVYLAPACTIIPELETAVG